MKKYSKEEILYRIKECANIYKDNLENKNVLFIIETKNRTIYFLETKMNGTNFQHLTGVEIIDNEFKVNSYEFYKRLLNNEVGINNIKVKDNSYAKLEILPQLMNIDRTAKMIGEYDNSRVYLKTETLVGNHNVCMGFIKKSKNYIPNTALNLDIRKITKNTRKIIGIMKKDIKEKRYREITYLKNNYSIMRFLWCKDISKIVDFRKLKSKNKVITKKINDFEEKLDEIVRVLQKNMIRKEAN